MNKQLIIFNPSIEDGGVEKNLFLTANHLSENGMKVILISADFKKRKEFNKNIDFIYPKKINFENSGRYKKYFFCLILLIKEIVLRKNVLIFSFQANIYSLIVSKILGKKIIVRLNTAPIGWDHNLLKSQIYKFFINKADGIIVNSKIFKNKVKKKYNVKSICILNPFDFEKIKSLSSIKVKNYFAKNSLKIINVGRLTKQKDQISLLKSVNLIKHIVNFNLVIIGKGVEYKSLKKFIDVKKLNNSVKLLGYKKNPFPYIKQADIFILSSRYEGSPNVLVEAMFLGKSIISTDCQTGPKEILANGKYGDLFKVGDFNQLSKILIKYKKNSFKKRNRNVLNNFNKETNCKKYFDYINKFI
jgi:glycosyltransferase involved in cell wall biosynthesis